MPIYNKLVRDRIPEIIEKSGKTAKTRILDKDTYYEALITKLLEEVKEFIESDDTEEIADILEVLDAILKSRDIPWDEVWDLKKYKRDERGGFEDRIFLEEVIDL